MSNATDEVDVDTAEESSNLQRIPIRFTLINVPDVTDIAAFQDAMFTEFKSLLTLLSSKLDGVTFTDVTERYMPRRLEDETQNFQFYYDALAVYESASISTILIEGVKSHHSDLLQALQEYKENYYYVEDFELCTPSDVGEESVYDLCSYDHEFVDVSLGVVGLPTDFDVGDFNDEMIEIYKSILGDVYGLVVAGVDADESEENGNIIDFKYSVDVLPQESRNVKPAILTRLESDDAQGRILNHIQSSTGAEICINDEGRYSLEPCASVRIREGKLPAWKVATISVATIILALGFCIFIGFIIRRRNQEEKEFNNELSQFRRDRSSRQEDTKHHRSSHRHSRQSSDEVEREHSDKRRHHRKEKRKHRSQRRHTRRRTEESFDTHGEGPAIKQLKVEHDQKGPPASPRRHLSQRKPSDHIVRRSSNHRPKDQHQEQFLQIEGP